MNKDFAEPDFGDILSAHKRIANHINKTPIFTSQKLNAKFGARVFFKMENEQKTSSFKARGAFNAILAYKEKHGELPKKIVSQSSGNHAQAIAYACKELGLEALVYMAANTSSFKVEATKALGAQVILCEKRAEANRLAEEKEQEGYYFIHPSANNDVILGQATTALEAFEEIGEVAAVLAPCGGGGLIAGCYLAAKTLSPKAKILGCEPLNANDAANSLRDNKIFHFENSPNTIADGARTLAVSELCFSYLKKLEGVLEIAEEEIVFWQNKFMEVYGKKIEPTSGLGIAGVAKFLEKRKNLQNPKILVIISGGNV